MDITKNNGEGTCRYYTYMAELEARGIIYTEFGEDLSWEYLSYVRSHPIKWNVPTQILYGEKDQLTSLATMQDFAEKHQAGLTVMENGEHWFHTEEQMKFLDDWMKTDWNIIQEE